MSQPTKLKVILACYACYMVGGFLSAWFAETNNRIATIVAVVAPTLVAMICVMILTQQVKPSKKKRLPRRNAR